MDDKKGFSLAETVIALAVIVVVSITALTIVMSSIKNKVNITTKLDAQNFAYNALECFKVSSGEKEESSDKSDFEELLNQIAEESNLTLEEDNNEDNEDETGGGETPSTDPNDETESPEEKYTYVSSRGYTAEIKVNFTPKNGLCSFSITITKEEKNLVSLNYSKAAIISSSTTSEGWYEKV